MQGVAVSSAFNLPSTLGHAWEQFLGQYRPCSLRFLLRNMPGWFQNQIGRRLLPVAVMHCESAATTDWSKPMMLAGWCDFGELCVQGCVGGPRWCAADTCAWWQGGSGFCWRHKQVRDTECLSEKLQSASPLHNNTRKGHWTVRLKTPTQQSLLLRAFAALPKAGSLMSSWPAVGRLQLVIMR